MIYKFAPAITKLVDVAIKQSYYDCYIVTWRPETVRQLIDNRCGDHNNNIIPIGYREFIKEKDNIVGKRDSVYIDDIDEFLKVYCSQLKGYTKTELEAINESSSA